ncbi:MAG: sugar ABC transporter permease [Rhodoluna sp.]|nr:sugar ABC transporter permease [Rhodoluna sp.]
MTDIAPLDMSKFKYKQRRRGPVKWLLTTGWRHLLGLVIVVYTIFPILYILSTSLYPNNDINDTTTLFAAISWDNYDALLANEDGNRPFIAWYINTVIIGVLTSIGSVFLSALAAYSFSRLRFKGRRGGLMSLILMQMFPSILGLVAIFSLMSDIGEVFPQLGLNSQLGLVMVYMGGALGGGTYLMYGFFNTVPKEIDEAAKIDGASHARIFFTITLRLVAPVLAVQMLLSYIGVTSDYVLASILLSDPEKLTLATGLQSLINDPYSKDWSMFTAGAILAALPTVILFLFLQKFITSGLTAGATKG